MESLEATYVEKFKCDGKECEAKCCRGWKIFIDDKTLSKYKRIKPDDRAEYITKHIEKQNVLGNNAVNVIKLTEEGNCPFICEDMLCYIQKNYGEEYLSDTCKMYPRIFYRSEDDFVLRSLSITCPVACHLILNSERPINFHIVNLDGAVPTFDYRNNPKAYMAPLFTVTGANILQYEDLSIDQRLATLLMFAESADNVKSPEEFATLSETFEKEVLPSANEIFAPLSFSPREYLRNNFDFLNALYNGKGKGNEANVYNKFVDDTFELLPLSDANRKLDWERIEKIYYERFLPTKKRLLENFSTQTENYLLHYFLMSGLPFASSIAHLTGGVAKFAVEYKLAEFVFVCFLYAMGEKFHEIGIELAAADYAQMLEHNVDVKRAIDDAFTARTEALPIILQLLDTKR